MPALAVSPTWSIRLLFFLSLLHTAICQTGYNYVLDTEYSGANFFNGWNFFTSGDPTNGFVQYVDQQTALSYGMINSTDTAPTYIGVDYTNKMIPGNNGAGRPSVRISTTKVWTHGLFIGDFAHAPGGICGTWPAWWTLGPNWPYTGEIDILEGVNLLTTNVMSLHTSPNYTIAGDPQTETGVLQATNCAYYQGGGNGVGCGVADTRNTSYGAGFNAIGGGVYAMQWTSDFIKVWFFPRSQIPADILNKKPDPSGWGLPAADLIGTGDNIDAHFVDHAIVFDNTFCGDYAGSPYVWNNTGNPSISCAAMTGYSTCTQFVGAVPGAFKDSYWSINSVRVYQLQDASSPSSSSSSTSLTPTFTPATNTAPIPTASASLCPTYNFTEVSYGGRTYEIECGYTLNGDDLGRPYSSYPSPQSFEDCVAMCNYWTTYNSTTCIGVAYVISTKGCYPKDKSYGNQVNSGQYAARLIWAGYGDITDAPTSSTSTTSKVTSAATSNFSTVTPVHYSNPTASQSSIALSTASAQSSILGGGMGVSLTSSYISSLMPQSSSIFYSSTILTSSALLQSTTVPVSSFAFSSSYVPISTSASSLSSISASSSIGRSSSPQPSSSLSISGSISPLSSVPLSSSLISSSQTVISSSMTSPSPGVLSSPVQVSLPNPSSVLLSVSSTPIPPTKSIVPLSIMYSSISSYSSSQSPSPSSLSTSILVSSAVAGVLTTSSSPTPVSSAPSSSTSSAQNAPPAPNEGTSVSMVSFSALPTIIASLSTTTSTTETPENGDATNYIGFPSTSTSPPSPPAATDEGSAYAGCLGYPIGASAFQQVEESPAMTIEQCLSDCFESFYAGVSGQSCYCGNSLDALDGLQSYPSSDCNTPCPGDPEETCGGNFASEMSRRRQSLILLTTYNNTVNINSAEQPISSTAPPSTSFTSTGSTSPSTITSLITLSLSFSSVAAASPPIDPPTPSTSISNSSSPSISGAPAAGGIPTSIGPVGGSHFIGSGTLSTTPTANLSNSLILSIITSSTISNNAQSTPLIISTVWVDVCDVCEHGLTTMTTTITTMHCGCTDTPVPTIPMTTTIKACGACGDGDALAHNSTVTVTCPDTSAIAAASTSAFASPPPVPLVAVAEPTGTVPTAASIAGGVAGSGYGSNASVPTNGTFANNFGPGAPGAATPARSGDVPLMTNSAAAAAAGSFGAPLMSSSSGAGSVVVVAASVAGPTETIMVKYGNGAGAGAGAVLLSTRCLLFVVSLVAMLALVLV